MFDLAKTFNVHELVGDRAFDQSEAGLGLDDLNLPLTQRSATKMRSVPARRLAFQSHRRHPGARMPYAGEMRRNG